ncbi:MAG: hypothetical protein N2746_00835 [Deltaproteobacteria bacterium]|nr:hypothetical protein [Deltaproteobacteria bacterium]
MRSVKGQNGSAIVEASILFVAIVAVILWSHVLLDIALAKIKTQEVVRYAAWEFTAYQLSDYSSKGMNQSKHNQLVNKARDAIKQDVQDRYSHSLDSAYNYRNPKKEFKPLSLSQYELTNVMVNNKDVTELSLLNTIISIINMFGGSMFGTNPFNNRGYVEATASIAVHVNETNPNKWRIQTRFMQDSQRGFFRQRMYGAFRQKTLREKYYLIVDDWAMYDGKSVTPKILSENNNNRDYPYYNVTNSVAGFKAANFSNQSVFSNLGGGMEGFDPMKVRLASVRFKRQPGLSQGQESDDGTVTLDVSGGEKTFATSPYCDNGSGENPLMVCTGKYKNVNSKRGNCYMGCPKKQFGGKWSCDYSQAGATDECQNP